MLKLRWEQILRMQHLAAGGQAPALLYYNIITDISPNMGITPRPTIVTVKYADAITQRGRMF